MSAIRADAKAGYLGPGQAGERMKRWHKILLGLIGITAVGIAVGFWYLSTLDEREPYRRALWGRVLRVLEPPLLLIVAVLGSILAGLATPTEAASVGAVGSILLALSRRELDLQRLREVMRNTTRVTSMVFLILIGASIFSLVFRGFGGDDLVSEILTDLPGGVFGAMLGGDGADVSARLYP